MSEIDRDLEATKDMTQGERLRYHARKQAEELKEIHDSIVIIGESNGVAIPSKSVEEIENEIMAQLRALLEETS